eukprot:CAMPEP_0195004904 /NCGR_PEP_ID=MMETSP0326_2-20130528/5083_1 /TAXON_ID=2866 ORGANISM="Crypthecodinium cohnii, Strain Seligo" /NCGR_SAMPLE_ID=MMETSP0326_2 /ASSEMBLY_ACC=CAM_ASM_000348 /LENGTH=144 /DNA_ID=CAMNT_0040010501 /DNA_START=29 /DNA_END=464 /DNA_ORIENTATION=-
MGRQASLVLAQPPAMGRLVGPGIGFANRCLLASHGPARPGELALTAPAISWNPEVPVNTGDCGRFPPSQAGPLLLSRRGLKSTPAQECELENGTSGQAGKEGYEAWDDMDEEGRGLAWMGGRSIAASQCASCMQSVRPRPTSIA